jgi:hypothetical protein
MFIAAKKIGAPVRNLLFKLDLSMLSSRHALLANLALPQMAFIEKGGSKRSYRRPILGAA